MKKIYVLILILLLVSAFPAAAAGGPPTVLIQGVAYIPINSFSQVRGFQYQWDPLLKNVTVSGSGGSVKFHVGSEYILTQGRMFKLKEKVRYFEGSVVAPASATEHLNRLTPVRDLMAPTRYLTPRVFSKFFKVVIDPGHGGRDFGAISPWGTQEKDLVLAVSKLVQRRFQQYGIEVIMTRSSDVFIPLEGRSYIANDKEADLFVSIHANASTSDSLQGFEVYYLSAAADSEAGAFGRGGNSMGEAIYWDMRNSENRRESARMANFITDSVEKSVEISNRRIKAAGFQVLKRTECPAVLVEMGYLTNVEDEEKLKSPLYQDKLARAIVDGVLNYRAAFEKKDEVPQ